MTRLTRAEEAALWRQFKDKGCEKARERLILSYAYLIPITRKRVAKAVREALWDEVEGEGRLALCKAVDKYDPERGVLFMTFALQMIRGGMLEWLRRDDWVPRSVRQQIRAGEEVELIEVVSLEDAMGDPAGNDDLPLADRLADPDADTEEAATIAIARAVIGRLVDFLPRRQKKLIHIYYWEDKSFRVISERLGFSESRAHQVHEETLSQLRSWLSGWEGSYAGR